MNEWITDHAPEVGQKCLVTVRMASFNRDLQNYVQISTYRKNGFVTAGAGRVLAWMPLPDVYEGKTYCKFD